MFVAESAMVKPFFLVVHSNFTHDSETYNLLNLNCTYCIILNFSPIYTFFYKKTIFLLDLVKFSEHNAELF